MRKPSGVEDAAPYSTADRCSSPNVQYPSDCRRRFCNFFGIGASLAVRAEDAVSIAMMQDVDFCVFSVLLLIPLQRPAPTILMHRNGNLNSPPCVPANRPTRRPGIKRGQKCAD
jgi:hypothetical protein